MIETAHNVFVIDQISVSTLNDHKVVCSIPTRANIVPKQFAIAFVSSFDT